MTPREYQHVVEGYERQLEDQRMRDVWNAWHLAAFTNQAMVGKLQPLKQIMAAVTGHSLPSAPMDRPTLITAWSQFIGVPARPLSDSARRALAKMQES